MLWQPGCRILYLSIGWLQIGFSLILRTVILRTVILRPNGCRFSHPRETFSVKIVCALGRRRLCRDSQVVKQVLTGRREKGFAVFFCYVQLFGVPFSDVPCFLKSTVFLAYRYLTYRFLGVVTRLRFLPPKREISVESFLALVRNRLDRVTA